MGAGAGAGATRLESRPKSRGRMCGGGEGASGVATGCETVE